MDKIVSEKDTPITGGTPICSYEGSGYRAVLVSAPRSKLQVHCLHALIVYRAEDFSPPILFVMAERVAVPTELIQGMPSDIRAALGDLTTGAPMLAAVDAEYRANLGQHEDCVSLEGFERWALEYASQRLGLVTPMTVLNDVRKGGSFGTKGCALVLSAPLFIATALLLAWKLMQS